MDLYRQQILDHYKNPRNFGNLDDNSKSHLEENPSCGDRIAMEIATKDGKIDDIKFQGEGCAIAIAATSMLTEHVKGKKLDDVKKLTFEDMQSLLGIKVNPARQKCATLGLFVLQQLAEKEQE